MIATRRVEGIDSDIKDQPNSDIQKYVSVLLTLMSPWTLALQPASYFYSRCNRRLSNLGRTFLSGEFECCCAMAK